MKLQKSFLSLFVFSFICLSVCNVFAEEKRISNLGDITLRFCNDTTVVGGTKSLELSTDTEKVTDVCIFLNNNGPTEARVSINFVDGTVTADEDQKKACLPEEVKEQFGQYITAENTGFIIQPGQTLQTKAVAKFPAWYAGTAYGCVTYQMLTPVSGANSNVGMFNIVARRANFVDINVKGEIKANLVVVPETNSSLEPINTDENIVIYKNLVEDSYKARFTLMNTGNVGVKVFLQGGIEPRHQFKIRISGIKHSLFPRIPLALIKENDPGQTILPNQSKTFEYSIPKRVTLLGAKTNIWFEYSYYPIIQGKIDTSEGTHLLGMLTTNIVFIPRLFLLLSAILGFLLSKRFFIHYLSKSKEVPIVSRKKVSIKRK